MTLSFLFPDRCDHTHFSSTLPDIVFVVDSSSGTGEDYFTKALEYIDKFVSYFEVGPSSFQFSVITYNFNGRVEFNLSDYSTTSTLRAAIKNIAYSSGPSYTGAGLRMARTDIFSKPTSGRRANRTGHVIILSDGLSSNLVGYLHIGWLNSSNC
ncbi:MAG: VWA domain-containing protein [Candidatus Thiodiazotropha sp.]